MFRGNKLTFFICLCVKIRRCRSSCTA